MTSPRPVAHLPTPTNQQAPTTRPSSPSTPVNTDPASTGVMKALVLVDLLREERRSADDQRLAALMRHR